MINYSSMKSILLLLLLAITPPLSSAFGLEEYWIEPDFILNSDPTVCYSVPYQEESSVSVIKTAINNWNSELKIIQTIMMLGILNIGS